MENKQAGKLHLLRKTVKTAKTPFGQEEKLLRIFVLLLGYINITTLLALLRQGAP